MYRAPAEKAEQSSASARPDDQKFDVIYRQEAPKLLSLLRRRVWLEEDRQDLVQEAFTRLVASQSTVASSNPGAYLQGILRHLLADRVRRWVKSRRADYLVVEMEAHAPSPEASSEINQMMEMYRRAVSLLPPRTREVYLLHRAEDLGYRQIAEQLGISIRTVEWHVAEAINRIGKSLGGAHE